MASPLLIAQHSATACALLPGMANRHGLITGATGTGKTVTLQKLAESFSQIGVPVFLADIKGDLGGISQSGKVGDKLAASLKDRGIARARRQQPPALEAQLADHSLAQLAAAQDLAFRLDHLVDVGHRAAGGVAGQDEGQPPCPTPNATRAEGPATSRSTCVPAKVPSRSAAANSCNITCGTVSCTGDGAGAGSALTWRRAPATARWSG